MGALVEQTPAYIERQRADRMQRKQARRRRFWAFVHNAVAHPLLVLNARWSHRFHDWTAGRM